MLYLLPFFKDGCKVTYHPKPEELICIQLASYLKEMTLTGKCKHVWFHVSNEGSTSGKAFWGARQRNMGKFSGVADYVFLGSPCVALEIKAGKNKLQDAQKTFQQWCKDCRVEYHVACSFAEAEQILKTTGVII